MRGSLASSAAIDAVVTRARARFATVTSEMIPDPRVDASVAFGPITIADAVRFDAGSATPNEASAALITIVGDLLVKVPTAFVVANGYTDDEGDALKNVGLAKERIEAFVAVLGDLGIAADRVVPSARGPENPIGDNTTAEGRALNRRIELVLHNVL